MDWKQGGGGFLGEVRGEEFCDVGEIGGDAAERDVNGTEHSKYSLVRLRIAQVSSVKREWCIRREGRRFSSR
jgi:hypothetical protein